MNSLPHPFNNYMNSKGQYAAGNSQPEFDIDDSSLETPYQNNNDDFSNKGEEGNELPDFSESSEEECTQMNYTSQPNKQQIIEGTNLTKRVFGTSINWNKMPNINNYPAKNSLLSQTRNQFIEDPENILMFGESSNKRDSKSKFGTPSCLETPKISNFDLKSATSSTRNHFENKENNHPSIKKEVLVEAAKNLVICRKKNDMIKEATQRMKLTDLQGQYGKLKNQFKVDKIDQEIQNIQEKMVLIQSEITSLKEKKIINTKILRKWVDTQQRITEKMNLKNQAKISNLNSNLSTLINTRKTLSEQISLKLSSLNTFNNRLLMLGEDLNSKNIKRAEKLMLKEEIETAIQQSYLQGDEGLTLMIQSKTIQSSSTKCTKLLRQRADSIKVLESEIDYLSKEILKYGSQYSKIKLRITNDLKIKDTQLKTLKKEISSILSMIQRYSVPQKLASLLMETDSKNSTSRFNFDEVVKWIGKGIEVQTLQEQLSLVEQTLMNIEEFKKEQELSFKVKYCSSYSASMMNQSHKGENYQVSDKEVSSYLSNFNQQYQFKKDRLTKWRSKLETMYSQNVMPSGAVKIFKNFLTGQILECMVSSNSGDQFVSLCEQLILLLQKYNGIAKKKTQVFLAEKDLIENYEMKMLEYQCQKMAFEVFKKNAIDHILKLKIEKKDQKIEKEANQELFEAYLISRTDLAFEALLKQNKKEFKRIARTYGNKRLKSVKEHNREVLTQKILEEITLVYDKVSQLQEDLEQLTDQIDLNNAKKDDSLIKNQQNELKVLIIDNEAIISSLENQLNTIFLEEQALQKKGADLETTISLEIETELKHYSHLQKDYKKARIDQLEIEDKILSSQNQVGYLEIDLSKLLKEKGISEGVINKKKSEMSRIQQSIDRNEKQTLLSEKKDWNKLEKSDVKRILRCELDNKTMREKTKAPLIQSDDYLLLKKTESKNSENNSSKPIVYHTFIHCNQSDQNAQNNFTSTPGNNMSKKGYNQSKNKYGSTTLGPNSDTNLTSFCGRGESSGQNASARNKINSLFSRHSNTMRSCSNTANIEGVDLFSQNEIRDKLKQQNSLYPRADTKVYGRLSSAAAIIYEDDKYSKLSDSESQENHLLMEKEKQMNIRRRNFIHQEGNNFEKSPQKKVKKSLFKRKKHTNSRKTSNNKSISPQSQHIQHQSQHQRYNSLFTNRNSTKLVPLSSKEQSLDRQYRSKSIYSSLQGGLHNQGPSKYSSVPLNYDILNQENNTSKNSFYNRITKDSSSRDKKKVNRVTRKARRLGMTKRTSITSRISQNSNKRTLSRLSASMSRQEFQSKDSNSQVLNYNTSKINLKQNYLGKENIINATMPDGQLLRQYESHQPQKVNQKLRNGNYMTEDYRGSSLETSRQKQNQRGQNGHLNDQLFHYQTMMASKCDNSILKTKLGSIFDTFIHQSINNTLEETGISQKRGTKDGMYATGSSGVRRSLESNKSKSKSHNSGFNFALNSSTDIQMANLKSKFLKKTFKNVFKKSRNQTKNSRCSSRNDSKNMSGSSKNNSQNFTTSMLNFSSRSISRRKRKSFSKKASFQNCAKPLECTQHQKYFTINQSKSSIDLVEIFQKIQPLLEGAHFYKQFSSKSLLSQKNWFDPRTPDKLKPEQCGLGLRFLQLNIKDKQLEVVNPQRKNPEVIIKLINFYGVNLHESEVLKSEGYSKELEMIPFEIMTKGQEPIRLVSISKQDFKFWTRGLLTIEKSLSKVFKTMTKIKCQCL